MTPGLGILASAYIPGASRPLTPAKAKSDPWLEHAVDDVIDSIARTIAWFTRERLFSWYNDKGMPHEVTPDQLKCKGEGCVEGDVLGLPVRTIPTLRTPEVVG